MIDPISQISRQIIFTTCVKVLRGHPVKKKKVKFDDPSICYIMKSMNMSSDFDQHFDRTDWVWSSWFRWQGISWYDTFRYTCGAVAGCVHIEKDAFSAHTNIWIVVSLIDDHDVKYIREYTGKLLEEIVWYSGQETRFCIYLRDSAEWILSVQYDLDP